MRFFLVCCTLVAIALPACTQVQTGAAPADTARVAPPAERVDSARLIRDISVLAADSMEGRRTGTPGSARARAFLVQRFREVGLTAFGTGYEQEFSFTGRDGTAFRGTNVVGYVRGSEHPERYLVTTAHYDHLGVRDGEIFNGADDNASGTAALLAFAERLRAAPPRHSVIIAALDAEEGSVVGGVGLQGARAFVANPPVPRERILANVNMDMISRNDRNELYAAGTYHYPALRPYVERVAERAQVDLRMGHDRPDLPPGDDWTMSSDHGAFHEVGIPFLYFGVEDHPDYHRPTDTFERIQPGFYIRATETVLHFVRELDRGLEGRRPGDAAQSRPGAEPSTASTTAIAAPAS
jgi:Zn-dependent M28 family amino/carboxypeptidase